MAAVLPIVLASGQLQRIQTGDFVAVANGGTGSTTASGARTALGLVIGTDVQAFDADLSALAALGSTGIAVRTAADTWAQRTIATANSGRITVTDGNGVAGNPTLDLASGIVTASTYKSVTVDTYGRVTAGSNPTTLSGYGITDAISTAGGTLTSGDITLFQDPTSALHAVTKQYVDAVSQGFSGNMTNVRVASTANITISNPGTAVFDGVTLATNETILLKDQSTGSENGLYRFNGSGSALTRMVGYDTSAEVKPGLFVFVNEGTANGDNGYTLTTNATITLGSTALTFTQTSGAGQIVAGAGLTKTGNTLDIATASTGRIVINADNIDLATLTIGGSGVGTFTKVTVDTYGRVTSTATATASDVGAQASDADLTAIAALTGTGLAVRTAADTWALRNLATASTGRITVTNPAGVAGDPTVDLASGIATPGTYTSVTVDTYGRVTAGTGGSGSGIQTSLTNQEAGSIVIGQAVYSFAGGQVKKANANAGGTKDVVGLVFDTTVATTASANIVVAGTLTATTGQWDAVTGQTGGLTPSTIYYLSNATAGNLTTTPVSTGYNCPIGLALSTTVMKIEIMPTVQM